MTRKLPLHVFTVFVSSFVSSGLVLDNLHWLRRPLRKRLNLWACAVLILAPLACAQDYIATRLPTLGGGGAAASGISDKGQIVGASSLTNGNSHAFLWSRGTHMQDLGTLGGPTSTASAINAAGQVVGAADDAMDNSHPFLWTQAGGMQDLGTLGGIYGRASGINNHGQVVGFSVPAGGNGTYVHAFLWTKPSGMRDLGDLGTGTLGSFASGINDNGDVIGSSYRVDGSLHAFLWTEAGGMQDLGTLGGRNSGPNAIDNHGQIVGGSDTGGGVQHAFLWTRATGMQDLGALPGFTSSRAHGIGTSGQVLGTSWAPGIKGLPFLWTQSAGFKILGPFGQKGIESADAINAAGQILASHYVYNRGPNSFTLTPAMNVTLVSSANPSTSGQSVTLTVTVQSTVQGPPPDGEMVKLSDGSKVLARVPLSKGIASFSTKTLAGGTHSLQASYLGDLNYVASKSAVLQQIVAP